MANCGVRQAQSADRDQIAAMCELLWPETSMAERGEAVAAVMTSGMSGTLPGAILVSCDGDGALTGFIEVGLRSHADGCDTAVPVGFVEEGWFVYKSFRERGIGRELMRAAEQWAQMQGRVEMASDTWIDDERSQRAHEALGYEVVDRCVHFRKSVTA
jgi:aminoglycoside 6'-N-acetyltransferase I